MGQKRVCIVYRTHADQALTVAKELTKWLHEKNIEVVTPPDLAPIPQTKKLSASKEIDLDLVVVLGGDGTFLSAVRFLRGREIPILGVNMGHLGFLTETRIDELYDVMELALAGKMQTVARSMLEATLVYKNKKTSCYPALNDVVVERGPNSRLIDLAIYSGKFFVSTVKADGLILASPTGTTAYCLAAGGPIVHPDVPAITVTPICPHTLTNRPLILPDNHDIKLKVNEDSGRAILIVDGQLCSELTAEHDLFVSKSKTKVLMLSLSSRNYFDVLRSKLRFGERA